MLYAFMVILLVGACGFAYLFFLVAQDRAAAITQAAERIEDEIMPRLKIDGKARAVFKEVLTDLRKVL